MKDSGLAGPARVFLKFTPKQSQPLDLPDDEPPRRRGNEPPLNRNTYVMLGVFLGWLGVHNFYAGFHVRGVVQLCSSLSIPFVYVVMHIYSVGEAAAARVGDKTDSTPLFVGLCWMALAVVFVVAFVIRDLVVTKKDSRGRWMR